MSQGKRVVPESADALSISFRASPFFSLSHITNSNSVQRPSFPEYFPMGP